MQATEETFQMTPCCAPLPDLEVPMINTMVTCLGSEHRKLDARIMRLAFAATRLAADSDAADANQTATEAWDEIRRDLWSHLQIEDEVVFEWGDAHHAIPGKLIDALRSEREEMRKLLAALSASPDAQRPQTAKDRGAFARTLLELARALDSHIERYDGEVLPSILRALFH